MVRKMKIMVVIGTRPEIIKLSSLSEAINKCEELSLQLVHTGQHYDYEMSKLFFKELNLPEPTINLEVGSGTHASQTGKIMMLLEKVMIKQRPDLVLVLGDTNSTLASALTAVKIHLTVGHIEAGARSYDMSMPEEINRLVVDHISHLLFAPSKNCSENLKRESVLGKVYISGDIMFDTLLKHMPLASRNRILENIGLKPRSYAILTLHRAENVDNPFRLRSIIEAIVHLDDIYILFPVHPRTMNRLASLNFLKKLEKTKHVKLLKPLSYHQILKLISEAKLVMTDSGGIQKEAFWLKVPCITLRENTEWVETVELGANFLTGFNTDKIISFAKMLVNDEHIIDKINGLPNPYGDGKASDNIVRSIIEYFHLS